jgi:WD40 repeat protein
MKKPANSDADDLRNDYDLSKLRGVQGKYLQRYRVSTNLAAAPLDNSTAQSATELKGHTALIYHLAFSPDGKLLATAGFDNVVKLWEWPSGKEIRTLSGHTGPVYCVVFHPSGTILASGSLDKTIRLWNVADGKLIREIKGHTDIVDSIGLAGLKAVASAPGAKLIASGSSDKTVRVWNLDDGKEVKNLGPQAGTVYTVAFSPDGKWLASAGHSQPGASATGSKPAAPAPGSKPSEPAASATGAGIKLWDTTNWKESKTFAGHDGPVTGILFTPDSANLLSIGMMDRTLRLWNVADGKELKKMGPTPDDLYGIAMSRDGKILATCGYGGHLIVWNLAEAKPAWNHKLPYVTYCLTFTPDGKAIVTGHDRPYVCLVTPLPNPVSP